MILRFFKRFRTYRSSVHFIYAEPCRYFGSTVMRGQQLSEIARKALAPTEVYFTSADYSFRDCTLVLTKWALATLSQKDLDKLKKRHNRLIFDPVDGVIPESKLKYADTVVAASSVARDYYKKNLPSSIKVLLVDHHVDPRLKDADWPKRPTAFRVGYFGELINTLITPKIKKRVEFVPVDNTKQNVYWIKELPKYRLHYAIRQSRKVYPNKPFIKGFTAAHCGANILIQASEKEAIRWLGKDYPYLLRGKVTEKKVLEMLDYAKKSYRSKEWQRGLETMEDIRKKTSEDSIGKQLVQLFNEDSQ